VTKDEGGEAETRVMPGGEAETRVMPGGEAETRVMPGGEAETRVMRTPPPVGSEVWTSPAGTRPRGGRWRPPRIVWFALLGIAIGVLLAVVAGLVLRGPDPEPFLGTWGPAAGSAGPLAGLVIDDQGGSLAVTPYSADSTTLGTVDAVWDDDDLEATLPDGGALAETGGDAVLRIAYDKDDDQLTVTIEADGGLAVQRLARVSSLAPGPAETAPAPAPEAPAATPTPAPTTAGSPGADPSPTASPDDQVRSAITLLQLGVLTWASENGGLFPPVFEVASDGAVGPHVDPWPANPFTGEPMRPGSAEGDFAYEQLEAGRAYRLTGFLSEGGTVVVP
jgi:hypothetical protein